ncbi:MAG: hypothetical protein GF393_12135 [Armatimonadia bacterium]|nr:hypothetical protein [Armatimonadia bacterium]
MATSNAEAVFELRPMNLADLLDAVIRLYRHNFGTLIRIAAVVHIPIGLVYVSSVAILGTAMDAEGGFGSAGSSATIIAGGLGLTLCVLLYLLTMPIVQGAIAKAVAQSHLGESPSVWGVYRFVLRRGLRLLAVTLLIGLIQTFAAIIPLLPGGVVIGAALVESGGDLPSMGAAAIVLGLVGTIASLVVVTYLFVKLFFCALAVVLEDQGVLESFQRSWRLTDGHFIRVAVTFIIVAGMTVVFTYILSVPIEVGGAALQFVSMAAGQALSAAGQIVAQIIVQPVLIVATVLLYYDLRIRKEGFDLVMMAETIGEPDLALRTPQGEARRADALYGNTQTQQMPPPPPPSNGAANEPRDPDQFHRP